ncbi:MAG: ribonuclease P protein component [Pirellula sp.]|jgi:ribonuclease P protein component
MEDHSFPADVRIKSRLDFDRAFREGIVVADNVLVLHVIYRPNSQNARLGLSISKRVGNAPARNHWKRLIREVFRKNRQNLPAIDIVARPKKGAVADYQAVEISFPNLISRARWKLDNNQN